MTDYVGETYRVTTNSDDFDGQALSPDDIDSMLVTIWNSVGTVMVAETEMTWSPEEVLWYYIWVSKTGATPTAVPPGSYRARCKVVDLDGNENWEYQKIRLSKNPV